MAEELSRAELGERVDIFVGVYASDLLATQEPGE
jgi:hypothetical protein